MIELLVGMVFKLFGRMFVLRRVGMQPDLGEVVEAMRCTSPSEAEWALGRRCRFLVERIMRADEHSARLDSQISSQAAAS